MNAFDITAAFMGWKELIHFVLLLIISSKFHYAEITKKNILIGFDAVRKFPVPKGHCSHLMYLNKKEMSHFKIVLDAPETRPSLWVEEGLSGSRLRIIIVVDQSYH